MEKESLGEKLGWPAFPAFPSHSYGSLSRRNDDDDAIKNYMSVYGDTFKGKEITVPKNTLLFFRDCTFEKCTFIIKS
jgi:hypothetical protein